MLKDVHLAESHRRQFHGEDWQTVATEIWQSMKSPTESDYHELCTGPDSGCECSFCKQADWEH